MKPRVVFLINSLAGGGAERVMSTLLLHSRDRSDTHDIHLVLLDRETEAYPAPDDLTVHRLDSRRSLIRSGLMLFDLLRRLKPDVVVSFLTRSNFVNVATARLLRSGSIISERAYTSGHHGDTRSGRISRALIRGLYPRADKVIAVSKGIAEDLRDNFGVPADRLVAIPNPVDSASLKARAAEPAPRVSDRPYIVGMGRLIRSKNFELLIRAFAASTYPGDLVILGQGSEQDALETLAADCQVAHRVHFGGFMANPFAVIQAAEAYVLPSNAEGFPNGLAEAMSLGLPVISTNCNTGPSELLDDAGSLNVHGLYEARFGLLVPVNGTDAMRDAISRMADPVVRADLAARARDGARRYELETSVKAYWSAVEEVLRARR